MVYSLVSSTMWTTPLLPLFILENYHESLIIKAVKLCVVAQRRETMTWSCCPGSHRLETSEHVLRVTLGWIGIGQISSPISRLRCRDNQRFTYDDSFTSVHAECDSWTAVVCPHASWRTATTIPAVLTQTTLFIAVSVSNQFELIRWTVYSLLHIHHHYYHRACQMMNHQKQVPPLNDVRLLGHSQCNTPQSLFLFFHRRGTSFIRLAFLKLQRYHQVRDCFGCHATLFSFTQHSPLSRGSNWAMLDLRRIWY